MRYLQNFGEYAFSNLMANKRIGRVDPVSAQMIQRIADTAEAINALPLNTKWFMNRNLEEVKIPKWFGDLIWPEWVGIDTDTTLMKDKLLRPEVGGLSPFEDYSEFKNACSAVASVMRVTEQFSHNVMEFRIRTTVHDILPKSSDGISAKNVERGFIPVAIDIGNDVNSWYFDWSYDDAVREYCNYFSDRVDVKD